MKVNASKKHIESHIFNVEKYGRNLALKLNKRFPMLVTGLFLLALSL